MSTETQTQTDLMKRTGRRVFDALNAHNVDTFDDYYAPNTVWHGPGQRNLEGLDAVKGMVQGYIAAFPDMRMTLSHQIAEGDLLSLSWKVVGTHDGPLEDIAATGKSVELTGQIIMRFEHGKIVEEWEVFDELLMLEQLGVLDN